MAGESLPVMKMYQQFPCTESSSLISDQRHNHNNECHLAYDIWSAVRSRNVPLVNSLATSSNVNLKDDTGQPPLYYAIRNNDIVVADILLNLGANIHDADRWGNCMLWRACASGHRKMTLYLCSRGAWCDARRPDFRYRSALHFAHVNGFFREVNLLVEEKSKEVKRNKKAEKEHMKTHYHSR